MQFLFLEIGVLTAVVIKKHLKGILHGDLFSYINISALRSQVESSELTVIERPSNNYISLC